LNDQALPRHPHDGALDRDGSRGVVDPRPVERQQFPDAAAEPREDVDEVAQVVRSGGIGRGQVSA
jgi:hypothetical protein